MIEINVYGEIETNASDDIMNRFLLIKDYDGGNAFRYVDYGNNQKAIIFRCETYQGSAPTGNIIIPALEALVAIAKSNCVSLNGSIEIHSEWSDYDNQTIGVTEDGLSYANTEVLNAGTDELLEELKRRGFRPIDGAQAPDDVWIVCIMASEKDARCSRVCGKPGMVRSYLEDIANKGHKDHPYKATEKNGVIEVCGKNESWTCMIATREKDLPLSYLPDPSI